MLCVHAMMDIRSFFKSSTSSSVTRSSPPREIASSSSSDSDSSDEPELPPPKKVCTTMEKSHPEKSKRHYSKNWEKEFSWLMYDGDIDGCFCRVCKQSTCASSYIGSRSGGVWVTKPFRNWKKAVEKMKSHEKSSFHIRASQALLITSKEGTVAHQLQRVGVLQREKNRAAMKSLVRCTHFLTRNHIAHSTNFTQLVDLVVSCGARELQVFLENASRNAVYTSRGTVVDFIEALGKWVEESVLNRLQKASYYSIMADECTDITTVEELAIFCRWEENDSPVESFVELVPLTKADAESISTVLIKCLKEKNLQVGNIIGMGFDGAATFSGKKSGVQARLKKHAPHAVFIRCHCHMLQLACIQAANRTTRIKHVYTTLTSLWKYFHYSPKRAQSLKEIQNVLELPELKVIKPSDTCWLAHEHCVKTVKENYEALVVTLESNYQNFHEPEALGLFKALCMFTTIAALYMLDYTLPTVAKLSKTLQMKQLDLTMIFSLVDVVLKTLDDAITPAANWVLELLDVKDDLQRISGEEITTDMIGSFQETVARPYISHLKENISSRFESHDIVSALAIFDPRKVPSADSLELPEYGKKSIEVLLDHYGKISLLLP